MTPDTSFQAFLAQENAKLPLDVYAVNLVIALGLAFLLAQLYVRFGLALSNRRLLAQTFVPLAGTTMVVIALVKSSLAISLGLVGALSIVRFRTAIKEPEELVFLFLAITIGLGLGANHRAVTIGAFAILAVALLARGLRRRAPPSMFFSVVVRGPNRPALGALVEAVTKNARHAAIRRVEERSDATDALFVVDLAGPERLEALSAAVRALGGDVTTAFLDVREDVVA